MILLMLTTDLAGTVSLFTNMILDNSRISAPQSRDCLLKFFVIEPRERSSNSSSLEESLLISSLTEVVGHIG